jgi:magnesium chelatase subunit I
MSTAEYVETLDRVDGLNEIVAEYVDTNSEVETATMKELVLEALHQNSLLGKDLDEGTQSYGDIMGSMLSSFGDGGMDEDDLDDEDDLSRYR